MSPETLAAAASVYAGAAFAVEPLLGRGGQPLLGAGAWTRLLASARKLNRAERWRAAIVIVVATCGEVLFSLELGFYSYRWHNVPLYAPAGHGLILIAALWLRRLPALARNARPVCAAAPACAAAWPAVEVVCGGRADELGLVSVCVLAYALARAGDPLLYACILRVVTPLELYATATGAWHWAAASHVLHVTPANPPCTVGGGYVLDALALRIAGVRLAVPAALAAPRS